MVAQALFDPAQAALYDHYVPAPPHYRWGAYGAFVGVGPVLLAAIGLALRRTTATVALALSAAVCFALSLGHFADWSPWALLHRIPPMTSVRFPSRFLSATIVALACLSMVGVDAIARALRKRVAPAVVALCATALLAVVALDLARVSASIYRSHIKLRGEPAARIDRSKPFLMTQRTVGYAFAGVALNQSAVFCTSALYPPNHAQAGLPAAFLLHGGRATLTVAPNQLQVELDARTATTLVINQNFDPRFRLAAGAARGPLRSLAGVLALDVPAGKNRVLLRYQPVELQLGLAVSALSLLALWLWLRRRRAST